MKTRHFAFVVITVLVMSCLTIAGDDAGKNADLYKQFQTFSHIVANVQNNYVEEVDMDKLFYGAYAGMLQTLDPHSAFLPPEDKENLEVETQGEFGGLGIEIQLDKYGVLMVVTPLEDTPAFKAGVLANDRIIRIEGKSTKNITVRGAVKKLRGPKGSPVKITVLHQDGRVEDITVVRDIIRPTSIKDPHFVDEKQKIAYLRMTQFQKRTAEDLDKTVKQLQAEGMRALIIDLRANPGGLLNAAVDICDRFTDDGVIVSTRGRKSRPRTFRATKGVTYPDIPVALLVSSHSASAAEIFAGAIQDHKRGVIVGVRSYGKGSVQSLFRLENGKSGIRLTTAHYYTPSGRLIHRNQNNADQKEWGIDPDIEVKVTLKDEIALWKSWRDRHQANIDKKNGTNGKDDTKEEPAKPDDKEKEDNWIPDSKQNPDTPPEGAKKDEPFVDRTLEAAVNAMKGMILAGERMAPAAEKAAK